MDIPSPRNITFLYYTQHYSTMGLTSRIKNASKSVQERYKKRQEAAEKKKLEQLKRLEEKKKKIEGKRRVKTARAKLNADIKRLKRETSRIHRFIGEVEDEIVKKAKQLNKKK